MSASKSQKRKNKKKYFQSAKKSKCGVLECGLKGFLISCNDEFRCVKEAYNLLNEYADEIYGPMCEETESNNYDDLDEQLAREIASFKAKGWRFQKLQTKVKGIIFISTTVCDPALLVDKIFESVIKTGKRKTRFILKLKPVLITCKAHESDILKALSDILKQLSIDKNEEKSYKVDTIIRHNDSITSSHIIWYVRDFVKDNNLNWTACILDPQIIISFYVLRSVCCISILDKYNEYKKYNLSELYTMHAKDSCIEEASVVTACAESKKETVSEEASVITASGESEKEAISEEVLVITASAESEKETVSEVSNEISV